MEEGKRFSRRDFMAFTTWAIGGVKPSNHNEPEFQSYSESNGGLAIWATGQTRSTNGHC